MTVSRSVIARRWLTDRKDFPEEPLENYLDVREWWCIIIGFYAAMRIKTHVCPCSLI